MVIDPPIVMSLVARRLSDSSFGALYALSAPVIVELLSVVAFSIVLNDPGARKVRIGRAGAGKIVLLD